MTPKTKKIIAREGLILIILGAIYFATLPIPQHIYLKGSEGDAYSHPGNIEILGPGITGWVETAYLFAPNGAGGIDYSKIKTRIKSGDYFVFVIMWEGLKSRLIFLLLGSYSLYLAARFIIWAVKILRKGT